MKIYLGDEHGNYELKKDDYNIPYVNSEELIQSLIQDLRYDDLMKLCKDLFNACKENKLDILDKDWCDFTDNVMKFWIDEDISKTLSLSAELFKEELRAEFF